MHHLKLEKLPDVEPNPPKNAPVLKIRGLLHRDRAEKHDKETLEKVEAKREKRERKRKATLSYIEQTDRKKQK